MLDALPFLGKTVQPGSPQSSASLHKGACAMFSMSKTNPFASVQPFRDDPAPLSSEQDHRNGVSSTAREATVAPAIVTTQSWGAEGEMSSLIKKHS